MSSFVYSEKCALDSSGNVLGFDVFGKARHLFALSPFVYDIKILYDLEGKETENFTQLATEVLGKSRTANYRAYSEKMSAHLQSYSAANISWSKFAFDKLLPSDLVTKIREERNSLLLDLLDKSKEKEFYNTFYPVLKSLCGISSFPVFLDLESIKDDETHFSNLIRKSSPYGELLLQFNPVGAKTGRLSFKKGTVNFYILPKELRKCLIAPPNFNIVQLDFKSFQPRLAIFCTESIEFKNKFSDIEDIYSVFPGDREENKISFISWMFSKRKNEIFENEAAPILQLRKELHLQARRTGKLTTKFGRSLHYSDEEENVIFQNYITASEVDAILSLMVEIDNSLKDKRSRIIFPFHDSLVLYVHEEEMDLIQGMKECMENKHRSLFGSKLPVSVKCGKNFEQMENWK